MFCHFEIRCALHEINTCCSRTTNHAKSSASYYQTCRSVVFLFHHIPNNLFLLCLQKQLNTEEYGPTMADLKKQIAAHNLMHQQIEAYSSQLTVSSAGGKVDIYTKVYSQRPILMFCCLY